MSGSYERVLRKCAECGAQCGPTAQRCWMCNAALPEGTTETAASLPRAPTWDREGPGLRRESPADRTASTALDAKFVLVGALLIIGTGIWTLAPGLAILYTIVVIPAVLAMLVSRSRGAPDAAGEGTTLGEQLLILFSKFLKTVAVLVLVIFGIVIAAAVFCFVLLASNGIRLH